MKRPPTTILLTLLLGCGSVVTEPGLTGGAGGAASGSSSSSGIGGATTGSSSSGTTTSSSSSGTGGACTGTCPSCTPFAPWSKVFAAPDHDTSISLGRSTMPDGSMILPVDGDLVKIDLDGQVAWQIEGGHVLNVEPDDACGMFVMGTVSQDDASLFGQPVSCPAEDCYYIGRLDADGAALWLRMLGPAQDLWAAYLAAGGGLVVAAGMLNGTIDLGTGPIEVPPGEHHNKFVVAFSADDGQALWTRDLRFPDDIGGIVGSLVVGSAGDVVYSDIFAGAIDFGDGVTAEPAYDYNWTSFVASYDALGSLRFGEILGGLDVHMGAPLSAITAAGDVIISNPVQGTIDLGGGPLGTPGSRQVMVIKLDAHGDHVFSKAIATVKGVLSPVAVDSAGRIGVVADDTAFLLDATGAILAKHPFGVSGTPIPYSVGFGPNGALTIAGMFQGTVDLGQGPLDSGAHRAVFAGGFAP